MKLPNDPRILLIRFSSLGDVVKCTALPRQIRARYPAARITVLTGREFAPLFRDNPHVEQVVEFDRKSGAAGLVKLVRNLRAERWDLIADVHRSLRSRVLGWFLRGARTRYSKRTWQRFLLINFHVNTYRPARGKEEDFLSGFLPHGVTDDGHGTELHVARLDGEAAFQERMAGALGRIAAWRKAGRPVIGVAPIAAWELKRWPLDHFGSLIRGFVEETDGGVVLFGGPGDGGVESLLAGVEDHGVSVVGQTSFVESAYFASLTDCVVTNDTGMLHLSEAVGADVVALFGPTSRELGYFPVREGSRALEIELACRPCTRTGQGTCRFKVHKACLERIAPEDVLTATLKIVARSRGGDAGGGAGEETAEGRVP